MFQFLITDNQIIDSTKRAINNLQKAFNNYAYYVSNGIQDVPIYLKDLVNLQGTQNSFDFTYQIIVRFIINEKFDVAKYLKANNFVVNDYYIDNLNNTLYDVIDNAIYLLMKVFIEELFNSHISFDSFNTYERLNLSKENAKFTLNGYYKLESDNVTTYLIQSTDE